MAVPRSRDGVPKAWELLHRFGGLDTCGPTIPRLPTGCHDYPQFRLS